MRIFKGTETTLKLFLPIGCKATKYEGLQAVLYTADPLNASIIKDVRVEDDVLYVTISEDTFSSMEEGVINYIINDKSGVFSIERQSNYFLKTPVGYAAPNNVPEPSKEVVFTDNGDYLIKPSEGYNSISEVLVGVKLDIEDIKEQSYNEGYTTANEEVAETARVLDITENGIYYSEFSKEGEDFVFDEPITGDGDFYDYIEVTDIGFNTGIIPTEYTKVELWVKPSGNREQDTIIFGSQNGFSDKGIFKIRTNNSTPVVYDAEWNGKHMTFDMEDNVWHHIILGKEYGLIIDGEVLYEPWDDAWNETVAPFSINVLDAKFTLYKGVNGCYGMIKIDDTVFIPSELGYINTTTNEVLGTVSNGSYKYFNIEKPICEGNLIRTVKVNIVPKINLHKEGVKLSYSNFEQVPDCFDFTGITTLGNMFSNCSNLKIAPNLNASEVTNISYAFYYCGRLVEVPSYDLSNATNMSNAFAYCTKLTDLSFMENWVYPKNADMSSMFSNINNIAKCPALYIEGNTSFYQSYPFWAYSHLTSFTDFGGFIGLKYSMDKENELSKCPMLSYESCINILNGLYDFVGNGETPNSSQGKLKVHQNFLDAVGDEITIGTNKGWTITV